MCGGKPSASAYIRNLEQPMPLARKLRLLSKNVWLRVIRMQGCCGNPGEPGC
jgi:hypothetical protein